MWQEAGLEASVSDRPALLSVLVSARRRAGWSGVRCPGPQKGASRPPGRHPWVDTHPLYGAHSAGEEAVGPAGGAWILPLHPPGPLALQGR